jgi:DNA-directed RNA polymerase specialized sigma24 family protein
VTQEEVWRLVLDYEPVLRREIRRFLPFHRRDELDEMYSDVVVARAHAIMARYAPERFPVKPITHLIANCKWYAYKWASGKHYKGGRHGPAASLQESQVGSYEGDHEVTTRVGLILAALPEEAARLLEWSVMKGYTVGEIAEHLGVTTRETRLACDEALALARREMGVDGPGDDDCGG